MVDVHGFDGPRCVTGCNEKDMSTMKDGTSGRIAWTAAWVCGVILAMAGTSLGQPANDDCASAIPVSGGSIGGTTVNATNDGAGTCGASSTSPDVWYLYIASADGTLTADTCGSGYDTVLGIWSDCPGSGSEIVCNDDSCGLQSQVTPTVSEGVTYYIRVSGFAGATGTFTLTIAEPGVGASCLSDDTCIYGSMQDCVDADGEFTEGAVCEPNPCAFSGPDVIYKDIGGISNWGAIGGIQAYSLGSHTCNIGDEGLLWNSNGTPGLAMNAYRLFNGRLEQIGQSWVKHACCVSNGTCPGSTCSPSGIGLRPGCQDVYSSGYNGGQSRLGKRSDINAFQGTVPPATGGSGNAIYKRLQIDQTDLQQSGDGALYFAEGLYVASDDAPAGNALNNASYKRVTVTAGNLDLNETGSMNVATPAIYAWFDHGGGVDTPDPSVVIVNADVPDEGRFYAAGKATDNGDGTWRYAYAIYNLNSHRSAGSLTVSIDEGVSVSNVGFHDVDYHSGEPYDNADWGWLVAPTSVTWSSPQTHAQNPDSNAVRWGTMYTFWFDANVSPANGTVTLGLFRPGTPTSVTVTLPTPGGGEPAIPTLTEWGILGMTLLLLAAGTIVFGNRRRATA